MSDKDIEAFVDMMVGDEQSEIDKLTAELAAAKAALASVLKLIDDSDLVRNTDNDGNFMGFFEQGVRITNALAEAKRILEGKE